MMSSTLLSSVEAWWAWPLRVHSVGITAFVVLRFRCLLSAVHQLSFVLLTRRLTIDHYNHMIQPNICELP